MPRELQIQVAPEVAAQQHLLIQHIAKLIQVKPEEIRHVAILKRSIDARQKAVKINLKVAAYWQEDYTEQKLQFPEYKDVSNAREVIIVGAGPAGLLAALQLIDLGLRPIVLERGKDAQERRRDLKAIHRDHIVNEDSNYCYG